MQRGPEGRYVEFFKFVETRDRKGNQIRILRSQSNRILGPIDLSNNTTIPCDILSKIDPMRKQEHLPKFQFWVYNQFPFRDIEGEMRYPSIGRKLPAGFQT